MQRIQGSYIHSLDDLWKARYLEKIENIRGVDPYSLTDLSQDIQDFPHVTYGDIVNYLVFAKSAYTLEQFKAFKSLESYNFFICGWVKQIGVKVIENHCVVLGKVLHSQKINEKPLQPWIICKRDGEVVTAHCNCVAGLGEVCSHVGAVLFTIDYNIQHLEETSVTGVKAYWKVPGRAGTPSAAKDINFSSVKKLQKIAQGEMSLIERSVPSETIPEPSAEELLAHLSILKVSKRECALFNVMEPFCREKTANLQNPFTHLYTEENEGLDLNELIHLGEEVDKHVTEEYCLRVKEMTKRQAKSVAWFYHRAGRVTASNFRACIATSTKAPSITIIRQVCYPTLSRFQSEAMKYGCQHEQKALEKFTEKMQSNHTNFTVSKVGLLVSSKYPEVGASPDAMTDCECCGSACVEIKCPYCAKNMTIQEATLLKNFCLDKHLQLADTHRYYYQCQMQMALSATTKCYFVVWTSKDIHVVNINFNEQFWEENYAKVQKFHKMVIMPELLGKFFTKMTQEKRHQQKKKKTSEIMHELPEQSEEHMNCVCGRSISNTLVIRCLKCLKTCHLDCLLKLEGTLKINEWICTNCNS